MARSATGPDKVARAEGRAGPEDPALSAIPTEVWRVAAVIVFGAFMSNMSASLANVGLDTIGTQLHASLGAVQWVTSGYLLALAGALPVCGWLGRHVGAGRLWLWSLVGFTVASGLCALAPNLGVLIVLRALQGVAGGLLVPAGQTVLGRVAGPSRMGRVMSTVGIVVVLAPAIGPAVGGLLIAQHSWRWLFLINLPIGVLATALGLRVIPRGERGAAGRFDVAGFVLSAAGLPLLTYGIITASQHHTLATASALVTLIPGVVALAIFVGRGLYHRGALLNLRLFGNRVFAAAATSVFFSGAALFGGLIVLPLYFELLRGYGVVDTGLLMLVYGAGAAVAMPLGGRLADRIGGGITSLIGLAITIASTLPMAFLGGDTSMAAIQLLQFARGIAVSLSGIPALSVAYATVQRDDLPDATAQANILQRVGGSLGSALFVVVLENGGGSTAHAFQATFGWLAGASAVALLVTIWLTVEQHRQYHRRTDRSTLIRSPERPRT